MTFSFQNTAESWDGQAEAGASTLAMEQLVTRMAVLPRNCLLGLSVELTNPKTLKAHMGIILCDQEAPESQATVALA